MPEDATLERRSDSLIPERTGPEHRTALVVAWSRRDGARLGELAWVTPGETWILGRPGGRVGPRLQLVRQRPSGEEPGGPIASPYVSREQLRVRIANTGVLQVHNVGRVALRINGVACEAAPAYPGDVIELDGELILLVQHRPIVLPRADVVVPFGDPDPSGLVGEGPAMWALRRRVLFIAQQQGHVLITGPSGAGKELVARALHDASPRRTGPLITCNVAAIPDGVAEAEWFGNRRDYPNPGMPARLGLAGEANGGTLLLDEIGELPHSQQAHLLRLLDTGEVQRLGDPRPSRVDLRIIGATNRDPSTLKEDLRARFPHRLRLPGLGARTEDIPLLIRHLLTDLEGGRWVRDGVPRITPRLATDLLRHRWSTHVRELTATLWAAAAEASRDWLDRHPGLSLDTPPPGELRPQVEPDEISPEAILAALAETDGVKTRAAKQLGLNSRHQLRRLMKKHGMI